MALVPINKHALAWAVNESGMSVTDIDKCLNVSDGTITRWIVGDGSPNMTQFRKLKTLLKRPAAIFFMDTPPESTESAITLRVGFGSNTNRSRSPAERHAIRDTSRIRKFIGGLREDLGHIYEEIPRVSTNDDPEHVATKLRSDYLNVSIEEQLSWTSVTDAFNYWRTLIERWDILVFLYPLGEKAARGFSFATDSSPVIGVSTTWYASVRVYTLFHELGHILTRTSSSCVEDMTENFTKDPIERWCESFATSFLMPGQEVERLIAGRQSVDPIVTAAWFAKKLFVSRKAALIRLVEFGAAQWEDFRRLESDFEFRRSAGRFNPDHPRTRDVVRRETYGSCFSVVREAHNAGLVSESDIRTYLRMQPDELM